MDKFGNIGYVQESWPLRFAYRCGIKSKKGAEIAVLTTVLFLIMISIVIYKNSTSPRINGDDLNPRLLLEMEVSSRSVK